MPHSGDTQPSALARASSRSAMPAARAPGFTPTTDRSPRPEAAVRRGRSATRKSRVPEPRRRPSSFQVPGRKVRRGEQVGELADASHRGQAHHRVPGLAADADEIGNSRGSRLVEELPLNWLSGAAFSRRLIGLLDFVLTTPRPEPIMPAPAGRQGRREGSGCSFPAGEAALTLRFLPPRMARFSRGSTAVGANTRCVRWATPSAGLWSPLSMPADPVCPMKGILSERLLPDATGSPEKTFSIFFTAPLSEGVLHVRRFIQLPQPVEPAQGGEIPPGPASAATTSPRRWP